MDKTEFVVTHKTNELPTGLKTARDMEREGFSEARIIELADAGYLPHYRIDGGPPLFKASEVKEWIAQNLMTRCSGRPLPSAIRVVLPAPPVCDLPPQAIMNIPALQQLPRHGYQPGVYFLCKGDQVVYVGQSISPSVRILQHSYDQAKDFDRVYLLPVPESELNDVEAAFIELLRPAQNGGIRHGREKPIRPALTTAPEDVLTRHGLVEQNGSIAHPGKSRI